jgi:hypothetical protein
MKIIRFEVGDRLEMKKKHPCGNDLFLVKRVGSDIRVLCTGCGRDMTIPRIKLEHGIRRVLPEKPESDA